MKVEYNIGFCWILSLVFMVLKLVGVIDWSWWWVFAPVWILPVVGIGCLLILIIIVNIIELMLRD